MKRILLLMGVLLFGIANAQIVAPMTESFNTTSVPAGWTLTNTTGSNWQFGGVNNNVNCPPAFDHTNNAGNYTWHDHSGTDASVILEMDTVDVSALTTPYLEFFYWMCGTGYTPTNSVIVEAYNGIGSWLLVDSIGTSTTGWEFKGYDISGFTYGSNRVLIRFRSESGGSGSDFFGDPALDDISIVTEPLCPRPSGLSVANITATTADLSWNISATASSGYKIISGPAGFNPVNSGTLNTSAASPLTLSSLTGNTVYDVYLIADCGAVNGESDTLGPVSFRTACVAEALGYFNGFENDATNAAPLCWANYLTSGNANTNVITFTLPNTGNQHVQMASSTSIVGTDTLMLMSPELLNLTSGNNQVRFFSKADNVAVELIVGTVTNPANPESFSAVDTIRFSSTLTYEEYIVPMSIANGYNGTDSYVAFKMDRSATFQEVYLDDFTYEVIPPCGKITGTVVTGVTGTTVTLSFNSSGTTTGYEWGPVGFSQGTGTTDSIPGNPITIGGLSASTSYDIYIRNDCRAAGNGTSIWSGPFTFTTLCAVLPAPYFQNFESSTVGHWDGIEDCWGYEANNPGTSSSGGYSWEVRNTAQVTSGTGTGPDRDNTLAPNVGGNFITADVSGSSTAGPDSVKLNSPLVDISSLLVPELSFYYHKWGSNMPDLAVDIWDGTWHRNAMVIPGVTQISPADPYLKGTIDLSTYNDTVMVSFRVLTLGCCQGDVGLDDIRFDEQPTCDAPSLLSLVGRTATSGVVNWVPGGSAVATNVEYGITGFTPGSGTTVISPDTVETITGLNSNTTYDVYIYDSCGAANGNSFLVGPITFTTKCIITPTSLPWNEGFESYSGGPYLADNDFCNPTYIWEFQATQNGRLRVAAGATYTKTGTNAFTMDKASFSAPASANFLVLNVDLSNYTSAAGIELGFSVLEHLQESQPDNRVWVRGSILDPWVEIVNLDLVTVSGTYVDVANIDIVAPLASAGQSVGAETQIRFGQSGTTNSFSATCCDGFTFDDISLKQITCPNPTAIGISGLTSTSAYLSWTASNNSASYQVWYGPSGFYQGSQTVGGTQTTTTIDSLLVNTFTPQTCYEYVVRSICGPGDSSAWVGPFNFCTFCTNQMSGTYTIDPALPASATNFTSFTAASVQLNDCGVSGPVTINVAAGTYTDHIYLTEIAGASSINTITFDGISTSAASLTYFSTSDTATVYLNGADWVTITNLTITNTSTSDAWGMMLQNGADNNTVDNCHFDMPITTTFDVIALVSSANLAFATAAGNNANDLTISNNLFTGAEAGIQLRGGLVNADHNTGIQILNNVFRYNDDHGIDLDGLTDVLIDGNDIDSLMNIQGDGLFLQDINDYIITNNRVNSPDWSFYLNDGNDLSNATTRSVIANNMVVSSTDYAMYIQDYEETDIFHNSAEGNPGIRINDQVNTDIRNNIFVSPSDFAFESDDILATADVVDYNLYFSTGASPIDISVNVYADLAAWQTADAARNVNSLEGDPVFLVSGADLHVLGSLADDSGDNTVGILADIDGDTRSLTTPDMGADEYTAVSGDLSLFAGDFVKVNPCLSATDTIELHIQNIIGPAVNFATNPLSVSYNVTGPINTSGTHVQNSGTLNPLDTLTIGIFTIDMSAPGSYTLNAYMSPTPDNTLAVNDTLVSISFDVDSILTVTPSSAFIINSTDSVKITATSPFFPGGAFFVSEIMHFRTATGSPTGGWPAWHTTSVDEHIEITGVPNSDLAGITLEQWNVGGAAPTGSITFPVGTVLSPTGTAVVSMQASAGSSPANFFYDGSGGNTINWQSGGGQGIILKDAGGTIIDAVGYPGGATPYVFPAVTGVTAADWSGTIGSASGTCGIRLTGDDLNNGSNWVVSSAANPQDPNTVNTGVNPPAGGTVSGFQWLLNGLQVSVDPETHVGPYTASGTYQYIAELIKCGITYTDTVTVTVVIPTCPTPATIAASTLSTSSASVVFDTAGFASSAIFVVEYGPAGFSLGSGTQVSLTGVNSTIISGLTQNLCQEVYMRVVCAPGDTSFAVGPVPMCPDEVPCDNMDAYATGDNYDQSALFVPWQNGGAAAWGDAEFSTTQFLSAPNSLRMTDVGSAGVSDIVAYFDTINSGAWEITFDMYVPSTMGGYFNIQQNHALNGIGNQWNAELYFQANGSCQVQHSAAATVVGSFTYNQGQWGEMKTIIDITNDSIWFEWDGVSTGLGYNYSDANTGSPLQFNGVNFFSGPLAGSTYSIDMYIDNFCVTPYTPSNVCADPTALGTNIIRCDSVELGWTSGSTAISSEVEWGLAGFAPGAGTTVSTTANPLLISGLSANTAYDFYVRDICASGTTVWVGPSTFNTGDLGKPVAAVATPVLGAAGATFQTVNFDGSASTGNGNTYFWRFADGTTGTGATTSHDYTMNQSWTVTLIVTNACGVDSITTTVTTQGIGLAENALGRSLEIYPNPAQDRVSISFDAFSNQTAQIRLLDLNGKVIMIVNEGDLNGKYEGTLDISKLAKGVYMLEISSGDLKANRRVIKK